MPYLIDTNIAIHLRDGDREIARRIVALGDAPAISIVTLVELEGGIHARPALAEARRARVEAMLTETRVVPFDASVVASYGEIVRARGYSRSRLIDRLIAATAIVHDFVLITINGDDFRSIPDLKLEIWPDPTAQ
ncbi:type II toxin-antitoxin system VapC family toxin [soil metagenome]